MSFSRSYAAGPLHARGTQNVTIYCSSRQVPMDKESSPPVLQFPDEPNVNIEQFVECIVACTPGPNYINQARPCGTGMNVQGWNNYAHVLQQSDPNLIAQIEYGFPAGIDKSQLPSVPFTNHKSAITNYQVVDEYIVKHLQTGAIVGPFKSNPLPMPIVVSPLQVACSASGKLRVVVDMSYGSPSVNDLISGDWSQFPGYFGDFNLPSSDSLAAEIVAMGPGCLIFKADMAAFYKQLKADPADIPYLGFAWRSGIYLDTTLPFGMRSSALSAQRVSNAMALIHYNNTGRPLVAYIDDQVGVARPETADHVHQSYDRTTDELGVVKQLPKCHPPLPETDYLGLDYDTNAMTVALPRDKLDRVIALLTEWTQKEKCNKTELQRLVGVLNHCSYVVQPGKPFTARLLDALRAAEFPVYLSADFFLDIEAWLTFLSGEFTGRAILKDVERIPCDYHVVIAVAGGSFACEVDGQVDCYKLEPVVNKQQEQVALCAAIYQVCETHSVRLSGLPHLVSVPTKVAENTVNRAKVEDSCARALLRQAWMCQARHDFVIRAKKTDTYNRQMLCEFLEFCPDIKIFKLF